MGPASPVPAAKEIPALAGSIPAAALSLTLAVLLAFPPIARGATPDRAPAPAGTSTWNVEFKTGHLPDVRVNRNIELDVHGDSLRFRLRSRVLAEILRESVIAVVYENALHSQALAHFNHVPGGSFKAQPRGWQKGSFVAADLLVTVGIPLFLAPIVNRQRFVSLVWKDRDRHRTVAVQVKDRERDEAREALSVATGVDWVDAPAERKRIKRELKAARDESSVLTLDREVLVAETYIKPGAHRAVVLGGWWIAEVKVEERRITLPTARSEFRTRPGTPRKLRSGSEPGHMSGV